ncbi:NAD(P)/FAD-dependent oxidoreductase [Amycolatopsis sp. cg5]|uniref:NAD(P)/FAD-dependent oxidoreductase n=1 Tax=Amycolatopsis sp. cg5 TaxID=3238802 RepID=UPI003526AD6A
MSVDVAVVGAGIAGLAAARTLADAGHKVRVFESLDRVGGRMATIRTAGYRIDTGAEQLAERGYESTWAFIRELGIDSSDAIPRLGAGISVWSGGRARAGVTRLSGLLTGAGLAFPARLDLMKMLLLSRSDFDPDRPEESPIGSRTLAELGDGRHRDLTEHLLQPVASGFFGWDPARSAAAPFLALLAAVGPSSTWRTYRDGMDTLARALARGLDVRTSCQVRRVLTEPDGVRVVTTTGETTARAVVLCVPAPVALALHPGATERERAFLSACSFTPVVKVSFRLDRPLGPPGRPASVVLVPGVADGTVSTIMADHVKAPDRVPAGAGLVTVMARPAVVPDLLEASDESVVQTVGAAAERYVPGLAGATVGTLVHRFRHGLPEATPAALRLRRGFEQGLGGAVDYAGDWVQLRPSSEGAVRTGRRAARRVLSRLAARVGSVR